ncbi:sphingomyelin phosphodiesterase 5-like, partial [Cuculus canorus]|uniref:sphingomyelin phosphodiesterase 5-like n=1 Tax=Cuculus canorus TaxID=55661 RepID=UPI0023AB0E02
SSPFPNAALTALDSVASSLLAPSFWATNALLDLRPTTLDHRHWFPRALTALALTFALAAALPLAALGLALWLPLQSQRYPFVYQSTPQTLPATPWNARNDGAAFTFATANLCLLPSGLAKFTNLGRTPTRAKTIARFLLPASPNSSTTTTTAVTAITETLRNDQTVPLTQRFPPDVDFVCFQEVFDSKATAALRRGLSGRFRNVLYDVGAAGWKGWKLKVFNSGLMVGSRYPVMAAKFHAFPNGAGEDSLAAKGVLVVQVLVGMRTEGRIVGYLGCTHLQAPAGDALVRNAQLSMGLRWMEEFQEQQKKDGDLVAFDVFCGDLNFDNTSPAEELNQHHEIFDVYQDPCREAPGRDQPWAIGTLLNPLKIYDEAVSTPENLKRTLSEPSGRRLFLAGPLLPNGEDLPVVPMSSWSGRRVDYVLHRRSPGSPLTEKAEVVFVTQLATLSDHLPVVLKLHVGHEGS